MCIVLNAKDVCVTGRKFKDKVYYWHTGQVLHIEYFNLELKKYYLLIGFLVNYIFYRDLHARLLQNSSTDAIIAFCLFDILFPIICCHYSN